MTFATQKSEPRNKRFMLVRVTPARYVVDDLSLSGGVYTMTFNYPISSIERNGTALTETTSTPGTNDYWYHDETTNTLQIKLASAPSTSNVIVVYYHLFYTGSDAVFTYEDPENSATTVRTWEPRITDYPEITQSISNVVNGGVFSIEDISLTIANADNAFQSYLTLNDSFHDKDIRVWLCLDSVSNIQKGYVGKVKQISVDTDTVQISAYDSLSRLDQPCFMGDTQDEAYYTATGFPNTDPVYKDTPIRFFSGPWSRYRRSTQTGITVTGGGGNLVQYFRTNYQYELWPQAVCAGTGDYQDNPSTSKCRTWVLGRCASTRNVNLGTPTGVSISGENMTLTYSSGGFATLDVDIGDYGVFVESAVTGYGILNSITAGSYQLGFIMAKDNYAFTTGMSITAHACPQIYVTQDGGTHQALPFYGRDFTYAETTTSGGNKQLSITFTNNIENSVGLDWDKTIHPTSTDIRFRMRVTPRTHGNIVSDMLGDVGLTVNAASITAANSALNKTVYCSYPYFDEDDYKTYREYLQDILQSTLGILYLNNSFEVEYALLAAPSSSNAVTQSLVLRGSASVSVDYQDIVDQIIAYNPHNAGQAELVYTETASTTLSSTKARYLNGIRKATRFRHVLNDISTRLQDILDVRSTRYALYRFRTATEHLDAEIGDDLQFEHRILLGGDTAKDLKILSLSKGKDFTQIEATDLEDI